MDLGGRQLLNSYESPCNERVALVIKGFVNRAKEAGQRGKRAKPLTTADLEKIRDTACNPRKTDRGMERPTNARRRGRVDIALISVMRDALLRRSEAAEVRWKHIATELDGSGRLTIPWSKTDQQAEGVVLYLGPPTMKALDKIRPREPLIPQGNEGEQTDPRLSPNPPKGLALALTQGLMGRGRRTGQARFQQMVMRTA